MEKVPQPGDLATIRYVARPALRAGYDFYYTA